MLNVWQLKYSDDQTADAGTGRNSGYTEHSGSVGKRKGRPAEGYPSAQYGVLCKDMTEWGDVQEGLFASSTVNQKVTHGRPHLPVAQFICMPRIYTLDSAHTHQKANKGNRMPVSRNGPTATLTGCQESHCRRNTFTIFEPYRAYKSRDERQGRFGARCSAKSSTNIFGFNSCIRQPMDKNCLNDL